MKTLPQISACLIQLREWEPNPVLVKELRQAMRNPVLTGSLMFFLGMLFLVSLVYLTPETAGTGMEIFQAFLTALTAISVIFVPLYTGIRLAAEHRQAGFELMFVTALPAWRIVRGKFLSAACIQTLFFSLCLPFMALTSLLRGVDLPTVFFILLCLYVVACMATQASIALAYLPLPLAVKIGIGILFTGALLVTSRTAPLFSSTILQSGIGTLMGTGVFWFASLSVFCWR